MRSLAIEPLAPASFAPFGDVIEPAAARQVFTINEGTATRYHDLARIDCGAQGGRPIVSIFRAMPRELPFEVTMLERHPLGSQAFVPLGTAPYLVVVGSGREQAPRAFLAREGQGVNFHRGTWHHPLFALQWVSDFLVIDRDGAGDNCEELRFDEAYLVASLP